jgi:hypothetical protein
MTATACPTPILSNQWENVSGCDSVHYLLGVRGLWVIFHAITPIAIWCIKLAEISTRTTIVLIKFGIGTCRIIIMVFLEKAEFHRDSIATGYDQN